MLWQSGDPYEIACDGCQTTCDGCSFEETPLVPMCTAVMEHAFSDGGTGTLETLSIERGYWRATPSSQDVLACYNADACLGGATGTADYCLEGYEGPCTSFLHPRRLSVCHSLSNECLPCLWRCAQSRIPRANTFVAEAHMRVWRGDAPLTTVVGRSIWLTLSLIAQRTASSRLTDARVRRCFRAGRVPCNLRMVASHI